MNALVLGCGRVGSGLARELTHRGVEVVVVDRAALLMAAVLADVDG